MAHYATGKEPGPGQPAGAYDKSVYARNESAMAAAFTEKGIDEERSELPGYDTPESASLKGHDQTHRKLKARHIQLIGIGGTIGTALYVQIGRGLLNGGPGSLFIAFSFW